MVFLVAKTYFTIFLGMRDISASVSVSADVSRFATGQFYFSESTEQDCGVALTEAEKREAVWSLLYYVESVGTTLCGVLGKNKSILIRFLLKKIIKMIQDSKIIFKSFTLFTLLLLKGNSPDEHFKA